MRIGIGLADYRCSDPLLILRPMVRKPGEMLLFMCRSRGPRVIPRAHGRDQDERGMYESGVIARVRRVYGRWTAVLSDEMGCNVTIFFIQSSRRGLFSHRKTYQNNRALQQNV